MGQVIQIDDSPHFSGQLHILRRRFIGTEHHIVPRQPRRMAHLQLGQGRTVRAAAFFL